ncbi:Fic family protein [Malacoplasma muris]|uniref:Fic family protein n=1 Tax=Malacoplasma muris TaxID=2119 RepID=UPI00398E8BB5
MELMKSIFILNEKSKKVILNIIIDTPNKCKLYEINSNGYYQLSKSQTNKQKIIFKFWGFKNNEIEKFYKYVVDYIYNAFNIIPNIKTSNQEEDNSYFIRHVGKIEQVVYALIDKYWDYGDQLKFVSELLINITHAHAFSNGNKRTALLSAWKVLDFFGLYLKFSGNKETYISNWEEFMINISSWNERKERETKYSKLNREELIEEVYNVIIKNIWLKL